MPRTCGLLTTEELRITEDFDATGLAEAVRRRELRCVDVARAFCKVCVFESLQVWDGISKKKKRKKGRKKREIEPAGVKPW